MNTSTIRTAVDTVEEDPTVITAVIDAPRLRLLASAACLLALLVVTISFAGLLGATTYARETAEWAQQATAQDVFDLVVAVPILLMAAVWASRGSVRGLAVLAGVLLFVVYTLAIYAFAVHLNRFFLVYCAALGVALFTTIGVAVGLREAIPSARLGPLPHRLIGGFLVGVGALFALLWLAQLVPATITGHVPAELATTGLMTNPVHVIDLSFILPLHVVAGVALWRRRPLGAVLAPVVLVFGALMSASIALLAVIAGTYTVAGAMLVMSVLSSALARSSVRAVTTTAVETRQPKWHA